MSTLVAGTAPRPGIGARLSAAAVAVWGVLTGVAPHVLHHVGPLAGAALLAGVGGKAIFFAAGLLLAVPMLRRLHRRFGTIAAPALAVVVFAAVFTLSSAVVAPLLTGSGTAPSRPGIQQPSDDHASHHTGRG